MRFPLRQARRGVRHDASPQHLRAPPLPHPSRLRALDFHLLSKLLPLLFDLPVAHPARIVNTTLNLKAGQGEVLHCMSFTAPTEQFGFGEQPPDLDNDGPPPEPVASRPG
jgi:hypothetical protein